MLLIRIAKDLIPSSGILCLSLCTGCGLRDKHPDSFGEPFNSAGGGVFVMDWAERAIWISKQSTSSFSFFSFFLSRFPLLGFDLCRMTTHTNRSHASQTSIREIRFQTTSRTDHLTDVHLGDVVLELISPIPLDRTPGIIS